MKRIKAILIVLLITPLASIPQTKPKKAPNILICIADDASFAHFSANGSNWVKTPAFDYVAKNGLLFNKAYTPNAKCAPSRACILTGRNSWQLEELGNHLAYWPAKYGSVFETLKINGYHTGYTGKGWAPGDPGIVDGKARELTGRAYQSKKLIPASQGISNTDYVNNFKDFLNQKKADEPFAFWFGSWEPHRAYEYGSGAKHGLDIRTIDDIPPFLPDVDSVRNDLLDYAFEVQDFDSQIAGMVKALKEKNMLDNTIIIVTSDNGMPFPRIKGQEYEYSNHLPLAIMWKDGIVSPGRKIDDFVSFIDFAPTFLELAQVPEVKNNLQPVQGKSLVKVFKSVQSKNIEQGRDYVIFGKERHDIGRPNDWGYPIRAIVKDDFIFIKNFEPDRWPAGNPETGYTNTDGSPTKSVILNQNRRDPGHNIFYQWAFGKRPAEELYNLKTDPFCVNNLALNPIYGNTLLKLKDKLLEDLKEQKDPRMFGNGSVFEKYEVTQDPDFYNRFLKGEKLKTGWLWPADFETDKRIIEGLK